MPVVSIRRSKPLRAVALGVATLVASALLSTGIGAVSATAMVAQPTTLTVRLVSTTGATVSGADVEAYRVAGGRVIDTTDGGIFDQGDDPGYELDPVKGKPGTYSITDLPGQGEYTLFLGGTSAKGTSWQWLGGGQTDDGARVIDLESPVNAIDASYAASGLISGTVTNASGTALSDVCVTLLAWDGASWVYLDGSTGACDGDTNSKGKYSIDPGAAGSYLLQFSDENGIYLDQYANGATEQSDAAATYLGAGKSVTVNTKLTKGGVLSGTLSHLEDAEDTDVEAYQLTGTPGNFTSAEEVLADTTTISSKGVFSIAGLATGYYAISYVTFDEFSGESVERFVGGASPLDASAFHVTAAATTKAGTLDVSSTVQPASSVVVTLTRPGGTALPGNSDGLFLLNATTQQAISVSSADSTGHYTFTGVPAGTYSLVGLKFNTDFSLEYGPTSTPVTVGTDEVVVVSLELTDPAGALEPITGPTVTSGTPVVGVPITADPGTVSDDTATASYQWYRVVDGSRELIRGAQQATYTPTGSDVGDSLVVRVEHSAAVLIAGMPFTSQTISDLATTDSAVVGSTTPITNIVVPHVVGTVAVGSTLGVDGGTWSVSQPKLSYQWVLDGEPIAGATGSHYMPLATQLGGALAVQVAASSAGYPSSDPETSIVQTVVAGDAPTVVTAPKVTMKSSHGTRSFTATAGTWSIRGGIADYAWTVDGASAGTNSTHFSTNSTGAIALTVEYSVPGHTNGSWQKFLSRGVLSGYTIDLSFIEASTAVVVTSGESVAVGTPLFVFPSSNAVPDGSGFSGVTYQLQRKSGNSWVKVQSLPAEATALGLPVPSSIVGKTVRYVAFVTSLHYATVAMSSVSFTARKNDLLAVTGTALIPAELPEGSTAKVAVTGFPSGTSHTYQWQVSIDHGLSWTPIAGAKSTSYALPSIAVGNQVRVAVTSTNASSNPGTIFSDPLTVLDNSIHNSGAPLLSAAGPLRVGATVSVTPGAWDVAKTSYHYQWQSSANGIDFTDIAGATSSKYKAVTSDAGMTLRAVVTASRSGYTSATGTSDGIEIDAVPGDKIVIHATPITGGAYAGSTTAPAPTDVFTSVNGLAGSTVKYQWKLNGKSISGTAGKGADYSVKLTDIGKKLQVTETLSSGVYGSASYTTAAVTAQKGTLPFTLAEVDGTAVPGNTVTALVGNQVPASIQWRVSSDGTNWTAIKGATHSTLAIPAADAGLTLDFLATTKKPGYAVTTITSFATSIAYQGLIAPEDAPSISAPQVGVPTTVDTGDWNASGLTFSYQWHAGDQVIPGATNATFTPLGSDAGTDLWVSVVASRAGWLSATASSNVDSVARGAQLAIHTKPVITGSTKTCGTLSVSAGSWSVPGVTVTRQWFDGDTAIVGATESTYQVSPGQVGSQLSVQLTAAASGYVSGMYTTVKTTAITAGTTSCAP